MCDLFAVHLDCDQIPVASNQHLIPFTGGLHRVLGRLHEIVDRSRIVEAVRRGVIDGDFETVEADVFAFSGLERKCADENAAIAFGADFEVERELEVVVDFFVNEHVVAGMRIERAIFDMRSSDRFFLRIEPAVGRFAIEQQHPARRLFGG